MATTTPAAPSRSNMGRYIGLGALVVIILLFISSYNGMVSADEVVTQKWADVESQYKRRYDLIDNLVATVKGAADFENKTFTDLAEARAKAGQITIDPATATPEQIKAFMDAQQGISGAFSRLLATVENYPTLQATQGFRDLMLSLEGTENRINVARIDSNESVKNYNLKVRRFPGSLMAGIFGFERREPFEAPEGAENAPNVDFSSEK